MQMSTFCHNYHQREKNILRSQSCKTVHPQHGQLVRIWVCLIHTKYPLFRCDDVCSSVDCCVSKAIITSSFLDNPSLRETVVHLLNLPNGLFQQDNAIPHVSRRILTFLDAKVIRYLLRAARFPDVSLIETFGYGLLKD
ncbi:hypothetical protein TNCV_917881 [Trichonephila clavipes]|nr:hypothetical protein TNCV_917881 [Trichonephila clavipes]